MKTKIEKMTYENRHGQIVTLETMPNGRTRRRVQLPDLGPSLTAQADKDRVDLNKIMKKYFNNSLRNIPLTIDDNWGVDTTSITDYQSALDSVLKAQENFFQIPAEIRKRFDNDPQKFIEFISDSNNYDEAIKLGFIESSKASSYLEAQKQKSIPPQAPLLNSDAPKKAD